MPCTVPDVYHAVFAASLGLHAPPVTGVRCHRDVPEAQELLPHHAS